MRKTLLSNKRGVEIAINYIVSMVLAIATLSLGFYIVRSFTSGSADQIQISVDTLKQRTEILLCSSNEIVCLSGNNQRIHRNEYAYVTLHIKNIDSSSLTLNLEVNTIETKGYLENGDLMLAADLSGVNIVPLTTSIAIGAKETGHQAFGMYVKKTAVKGTYSFLVEVTDGVGGTVFPTRKDRILVQVI